MTMRNSVNPKLLQKSLLFTQSQMAKKAGLTQTAPDERRLRRRRDPQLLHSRGRGDVLALRLEAVLVGDVHHSVGHPVRTHVGVGPLHHDGFAFLVHASQFPGLFVPEAVAGLHAESERSMA